jgi:hypothetical protein
MHQTQLASLNNHIQMLKNKKDNSFWSILVAALAPAVVPVVTKLLK